MTLYQRLRRQLPPMSPTEEEALAAGGVGFERELFRGRPDWRRLPEYHALNAAERAFLDGPVRTLCAMLDEWKINELRRDLPPEVWAFLRSEGFFGLIIPERYGGKGFSAAAHSAVVQMIASRSVTAAVTVMVPNSLGPAELLIAYGTDRQREYYLPRLATGEEIPCFALTGPWAGSDAAAMRDRGVVCRGEWQGKQTLGFRLTFDKRYITLAPIATLIGLAFHASDPDHLLGDVEDLGITLALLPGDLPGLQRRRHRPIGAAFHNGPLRGRDLFIPLEQVIGGGERIGQGWRMVMERLATGRGISLPALACGAGKLALYTSARYCRIRRQFHRPIGDFDGVALKLAAIAGRLYLMDAGRRMTLAAIDGGVTPAVLTAVVKHYLTEEMRRVVNDAMDLHGGRAICQGASNYLAHAYQSLPIAITVEGANILTRGMIIFGQGVMRAHRFLRRERELLASDGGEAAFHALLRRHLFAFAVNAGRALLLGLSDACWARAPAAGGERRYYQHLGRMAALFALLTDLALALLGGGLKRNEAISGRLADALAWQYLCTSALEGFNRRGSPRAERPVLDWACRYALHRAEQALLALIANLPLAAPARALLRLLLFPFGRRMAPPDDALGRRLARAVQQDEALLAALTEGMAVSSDPADPVGRLDAALAACRAADPLEAQLARRGVRFRPEREEYAAWLERLVADGTLDAEQVALLRQAADATARALAVDSFPLRRSEVVQS
ncbi:MAG: acyl-CoA dehydrogenase [Zetaproteobacteria bacterium]|nr:MAG: acyl-CoA dehydrogenase [Zetaproteobacteria bacterium]